MRAYPISRERWVEESDRVNFTPCGLRYIIYSAHTKQAPDSFTESNRLTSSSTPRKACGVGFSSCRQLSLPAGVGSRGLHARKSLFSSGYVGRRGDEQGRTRCQELGTSTDFPSTALNRPWLRKKSGEVSGFRITRRRLYRWWTRAKHLRHPRAVSPLIAVFWHLMTLVAARTAMSRKAWL